MAKSAAFGLASGVAVVILTLIVVVLVNLPQTTDAAATLRPADARCMADVGQEQGYGLSRATKRDACQSVARD